MGSDSSGKAGGASPQGGRTLQFCSFLVAGRLYGADILKVKEITGETSFTPVFHAPPEVKGLLNIRGQINLVLDLRMLLGFASEPLEESFRVVLFKPAVGEAFGLLVDAVGDVVAATDSMIEWRSSAELARKGVREGACRMETGACKLAKSLMVIIDPSLALPMIQARLPRSA
jgi:purine-binding chemotaxis protein CheW